MKLCASHWAALRKAIDDRGLSRFVTQNPAHAMKRFLSELAGEAGPDDYDPLMAANNLIWANAVQCGGLEVMAPNEDGTERCPLCFLNARHQATCDVEGCSLDFDNWVDLAANEAASYVEAHLTGS